MRPPENEAAPTSQAGADLQSSDTCTDNRDTTDQFVNAETVLKPQAPSSPSITLGFERPGVSSTTLAAAGVRKVTSGEAFAALGFAAEGLLIPYRTLSGDPLEVNGRAFARLRLKSPKVGGPKYLSPAKSGCHPYFPPGLKLLLKPGCVLGMVEGEFKALALVEAGFPCVGIGGISSACPKDAAGDPQLLPPIAAVIAEYRPKQLAFIGDADTALIPDFSREAIKLAGLTDVPVVLPRIPYDAPGKGPDDLRHHWGDQFGAKWLRIQEDALTVPKDTTLAKLTLRLLKRETDAISGLDAERKEAALRKFTKLAAHFLDEPIDSDNLRRLAAEVFGLDPRTFKKAVESERKKLRHDQLERKKEDALAKLSGNGSDIHFDGKWYWRREADGAYGRIARIDVLLGLNKAGLSEWGSPSPCDDALFAIQVNNRIDYAGPLCGRPAGLHEVNGIRVLATKGPNWIEGVQGKAPDLTRFIANLFGAGVDEHAERQLAQFCGWLKQGRRAMRNFQRHIPGHVLGLVGPAACGKTLLQNAVITPALGGRSADPSLFLTGGTPFTGDLWGAEHLAVGDKALDVEGRQRATMRNELKRIVAEEMFPLHAKGVDALTLTPIWRLSVSANSDPESICNLPSLDGSFRDKVIYLRCYTPPEPLFDARIDGARERFRDALRDQLPAFLWAVDNYAVPEGMQHDRFGIVEWHHPEIVALLDEGDPLRPFVEVMEDWIASWPEDCREQVLSTQEIFQALDSFADVARLKVSSGVKHLGHQIAKLAERPDWAGRLTRSSRRVGPRTVNKTIAGWRIQASQ
jgi:hypothetical protein